MKQFEEFKAVRGRPKGSKNKKSADPAYDAMMKKKAMKKEELGPIMLEAIKMGRNKREAEMLEHKRIQIAMLKARNLQNAIDAGKAELKYEKGCKVHELPGTRTRQIYARQGM